MVFEFDRELFITKVYERMLRASLKGAIRDDQVNPLKSRIYMAREETKAKKQSQALDELLVEDSRRIRREVKLLLMGSADSGKEKVLLQMKILSSKGSSDEELESYRQIIYKNVLSCAKSIVQAMEELEIYPDLDANQEYCVYLMNYELASNPDQRLNAKVMDAITSLWQDPCIKKLMEDQNGLDLIQSAE